MILPLLAIPAFIVLGRSDFFLHHGASVWVQSNDAVFDMHDRDCDVLVFGDSTAMTGINPDVVQSHTGYKTCNIAVTNAVLAVTNNLALDSFLAHNARPRILLVQLSPDDFQSSSHSWHQTIYAEGLLELLRHGAPSVVRRTLVTHPQEAVAFAGYAAGFTAYYSIKDVWFHVTHLRSEEDNVRVRNGFFTPPAKARTFCDPSEAFADPTEGAFSRSMVQKLRTDYGERSGLVLVNVAPIPSCDQNLAAYEAELDGVTSNSLLPLPIGLFNDGRHYTAMGSTVVSRLIANELNEQVSQNPDLDERVFEGSVSPALRRTSYKAPGKSPSPVREHRQGE
ncbi:hypothetical protein SAMN05421771_2453 [Granulicella pectinivorans]|uniref:Uncharacterized protein n=1 Tax=Granulicella pectinivorans TaxID=474950 RepID=A0A1I6MEK2_9BACT|nr:hypothetical protein [Granulicella pectinivorans]SFS14052.1 hypothetical protein SAMN05421771_2453 [Granulicella pectinivorans]